jgi:hypothetical protein
MIIIIRWRAKRRRLLAKVAPEASASRPAGISSFVQSQASRPPTPPAVWISRLALDYEGGRNDEESWTGRLIDSRIANLRP